LSALIIFPIRAENRFRFIFLIFFQKEEGNMVEKLVLLREKEVAEYLGVSPKTLQAWRFRGRGPVYRKIGRACLYEEGDLKVFLDASRRQSTSDSGPKARAAAGTKARRGN
jgi:uncharacterized protein YjcR